MTLRQSRKWTCQNLKLISKKNGEIQIPSQWFSYIVVNLIFHYYFEIDILTTYKMIYNNDPAEVQEYA